MSDHYILPSELALLIAILFLPPLLLSTLGQVIFFHKAKIWGNYKTLCISTILATATLSPVIGLLSLSLPIPHWLSATNDLFVLPIAFVIVFFVACLFSFLVHIYGQRKSA